jgi:autotransporter translocation and assembly factor TamB
LFPSVKVASLDLLGTYEDSSMRLERFRVWSGNQEIVASGTVGADSLQIDGTLKGISIGNLLETTSGVRDLTGSAGGEFHVRGTLASPRANARVAVADFQVHGQSMGTLDVLADYHDGTVSVQRLHLEQPRKEGFGTLEASGAVTLAERRFQFSATGSRLGMDDAALRGDLNFQAEGSGSFESPEVKVVAEASGVAADELPIGHLHAEIGYRGGRAIAVLKAPDLNVSARAEVQAGGEYPVNFEITSTGTRLGPSWFEGTAGGSAVLAKPELQTASVSLRTLGIDIDGYKIAADGPVQADYRNGRLNLAPVWLSAPSARIQVSGNLPLEADQPEGKISIAGRMRLDEALKGLDVEAGGEVNIDAAISGSVRQWEPRLNLTLTNGRAASKSWPAAAGQFTAEAHITDGVLRLEKLTGKLGGGDVRGSFTVPLHLIADRFRAPVEDPGQPIRWSLATDRTQLRLGGEQEAGATVSRHGD